jgi:hypothetical protein
MKAFFFLIGFLALLILSSASAQEPKSPTPADLEAKFITTMTNATFKGRWCGVKDGQLSPDKEDSYTIAGVTKLSGDNWTITAKMPYQGKLVDVPIPAKVQWAGDTPVLILDNVGLGGSRTYSARVMVYDNAYAGTWSAVDHGGLVMGVITHGKN